MLPKGYKVVIDWFQDVAEDPDYENPHMRNETRNMRGEIVDSDDDDEPQKYWSPDEYEPWTILNEKPSGVKLEEIKDEPEAKDKPSVKEGFESKDGESKIVGKKDKPTTMAAQKGAFTALGKPSKFAAGFKDILAQVATNSADAVKTLPIRVSVLGGEDEQIAKDTVAVTDVKVVNEKVDNADAEDVL